MAKEQVGTVTGNRVQVELDGRVVGVAQSMSATDSYGLEFVSGIGNIKAIEYVPTRAMHSIRLSVMMLYKQSLLDVASNGSGQYAAIGAWINNGDAILRGVVYDIAVRSIAIAGVPTLGAPLSPAPENNISRLIRKYLTCSFDEGSIQVQKHAILVFDASFRALDVTFDDSNVTSLRGLNANPLGLTVPGA